MAYLINLHSDDLSVNHKYALKVFNQQGRSADGVKFHFIKGGDAVKCIVTTSAEERARLSQDVREAGVSYNKLKQIAF